MDVREVRDYVLEALGVKLSQKVLVPIIDELLDEEEAAAAAATAPESQGYEERASSLIDDQSGEEAKVKTPLDPTLTLHGTPPSRDPTLTPHGTPPSCPMGPHPHVPPHPHRRASSACTTRSVLHVPTT